MPAGISSRLKLTPSRPCGWVRWLVVASYAGLVAWCSLTPANTFESLPHLPVHSDKAIHFLLYGLLVALMRWALTSGRMIHAHPRLVLFGAIGFGICMEILQMFLVNYSRSFECLDIVANSAGAVCFWWLSNVPRFADGNVSATLVQPAKRWFDVIASALGLGVLSPVFLLLAVAVKLSDGGAVFFRQQRVGRGGRLFWILKFRSMVVNAERIGLSVTKDGDPRITRIGQFMRKTKLDELPQLWNVLSGEMSFVGPRPEVPKYVAQYTEAQAQVLALKPGITDLATLEFRNEEDLLCTAENTEQFYLEYCVPRKIALNLAYARHAGMWEDLKIILRTLFKRLPLKSHVELSGWMHSIPPVSSATSVAKAQIQP